MKNFVRRSVVRTLVTTVAVLVGTAAASAADLVVKLTGAEETPPAMTSASGVGTISISADKRVKGTIKTTGLEGTMGHIHEGAPGVSGPPIITLTKDATGMWSVPAGSTLTDEQYASFKGGNLYVNIHSAERKPGEIRAQLRP